MVWKPAGICWRPGSSSRSLRSPRFPWKPTRLEQVRAALSHKFPDGNFEQVVREAFKLVLERDKKRKALTDRPRAQSETPGANDRYVPKGHNLMKAEQHLGRALMAKFRKDGPAKRDTS
jgi:hypothetical protein